MDISFGLDGCLVVVTGASGHIGKVIVDAFLEAGCCVVGLDIKVQSSPKQHERLRWIEVDITSESVVRNAWSEAQRHFNGRVPTVCVCAAGLDLSYIDHHQSVADMPVEQFRRTLDVNTTGTFITAKTWLKCIKDSIDADTQLRSTLRNVSLIIIGSEAGVLGVPGNADYAASKSAIQYGLTMSLAPEAARIFEHARVNAIAPGAVNTPQFQKECEAAPEALWVDAQVTVASKKPVEMEHVAKTCLMLASNNFSGSTTGQVIRVDGGKSGRMYWDRDGRAI
ncbi:hypothetical protein PMZ80_010751 [Knufia obscura]|uniref:Uncharacterized protein n=1 Tax=Knufia obscura TaxID=1635080 RepID=A0ABR0R8R6_9EURO|nr:hypothetical protein PMZ80_010751 [Knufia obscura]